MRRISQVHVGPSRSWQPAAVKCCRKTAGQGRISGKVDYLPWPGSRWLSGISGFFTDDYIAAVVGWSTRRVVAWRLSITMEVDFCLEAVEEALAKYPGPEIFNTDQGSQFTSAAFTGLLLDNKISISMDGRGSWRDNVFVEWLWRSVKYEEVYLRAHDSVGDARASLGRYLAFYNAIRPHSSLDARTPDAAYFNPLPHPVAA